VKALVKSREERGLWLEDVPEPEMGINDVKNFAYSPPASAALTFTSTDWDAWAHSTIQKRPPP